MTCAPPVGARRIPGAADGPTGRGGRRDRRRGRRGGPPVGDAAAGRADGVGSVAAPAGGWSAKPRTRRRGITDSDNATPEVPDGLLARHGCLRAADVAARRAAPADPTSSSSGSRPQLGLYVLAPGEPDLQQPHTEDEVYYVVSGRGRITVGDEVRDVEPGSIFVASGVPHRIHDITES